MVKRADAKRLKDNIFWDDNDRKYRYKSSKKALSDKQVYKIVSQEIGRYEAKIIKLSDRFVNGNISFADWQYKMSELTRNAHVSLLRIGRGGKDKTYAIHYLEVGRELKDLHYPALQNFAQEINQGKLTKAQIIARAKLYARSSRLSYELGTRKTKQEQGNWEAKRELGTCANHCQPCLDYAKRGWVNLSDLILPTKECDCMANCCCSVRYREKP